MCADVNEVVRAIYAFTFLLKLENLRIFLPTLTITAWLCLWLFSDILCQALCVRMAWLMRINRIEGRAYFADIIFLKDNQCVIRVL